MDMKTDDFEMTLTTRGHAERIWEGIRFREIDDPSLAIDGYWVGESGDIWSCWKVGKNGHLTDRFQRKMKHWFDARKNDGPYVTFRGEKRGVARLVLKAFGDVQRFKNGFIVMYLNSDKGDNRLINLNPVDVVEYFATLPGVAANSGRQMFKKKPLDSLGLDIIKLLIEGESQSRICESLGCNHKVVMRIRKMLDNATENHSTRE